MREPATWSCWSTWQFGRVFFHGQVGTVGVNGWWSERNDELKVATKSTRRRKKNCSQLNSLPFCEFLCFLWPLLVLLIPTLANWVAHFLQDS
ncbi:hypothetical protein Pla144_06240 [Bythopirellula polymerisocia]|uniref:Uncharacterized protein n=1 Tax=Bythopirellula polymerisocia TaxID=2528003 RepID=A0A5C6D1Y0_9BACT|nr:hypothetical protein Pla144_06240 [Bythopirellula polymerisocia]